MNLNCKGRLHVGIVLHLLIVMLAVSAAFAGAQQPTVTLAAGASIEQAVAELARAIDGVVVADIAVKERTLQKELKAAPLDEALAAISVDFDRHWVRRGRGIALQLRRSDPEEPPLVELEELVQVSRDLARIISVVPELPDEQWPIARARFVASLTAQQQQRAIDGGLPFDGLSDAQQRALMQLSLVQTYDAPVTQLGRASKVLQALDQGRADLSIRVDERNGAPYITRGFYLFVTDPAVRGGRTSVSAAVNSPIPVPAETMPSGRHLPSTDLEGPAWATGPRTLTLSEFSSEWRRAIGTPLRIPAYAADRRFVICSASVTRTEAVAAVADLWGWDSASTRDGRRLGRAAFTPAENPLDLHTKMSSAIPPAIWHAVTAVHDSRSPDFRWIERRFLELFGRQFETTAPQSRSLALAALSEEDRRVVATLAVVWQASSWYGASGTRRSTPVPRAYLVFPERIVLTLSGPLGTDPPPSIRVAASSEAGGTQAWEWPARTEWPPKKPQ